MFEKKFWAVLTYVFIAIGVIGAIVSINMAIIIDTNSVTTAGAIAINSCIILVLAAFTWMGYDVAKINEKYRR